MGSEFASDVGKSDRVFSSSGIYCVGSVLAFRFLCLRLVKNFCAKLAGFTTCSAGNGNHRRGGLCMQLKMFVLSGAAVALWLVPLNALDKKVSWHKAIQGLSLGGAVACAIGAGNIARKLAEENEIEQLKLRAIKADVEDEISTSVYVSQQQRQQEAEAILNPVERLERTLALTCGDGGDTANVQNEIQAEDAEERRAERVLELKAKGWGKAKIILEVWGISKGGSQKYKDAEALYERLINNDETW